jgi:hypothetical protein
MAQRNRSVLIPKSEQPELRQTVADAINQVASQHGEKPEQKMPAPVRPEQVSIPCQRTWYAVETLNQKVNGADFSACVANITQEDGIYPWFFLVCRLPGDSTWQPIGSQGGERRGSVQRNLGKLHVPRTCICVGGLSVVPNGGSIQIELSNGERYEDAASDGCCIAFAPLTTESLIEATTTIRYFDADGSEITIETI